MKFSGEIGPTFELVCYPAPRDGDKTRDSGERALNHPKKEGNDGGRRKDKIGTTGPEEEDCPSQQALVLSLINIQSWVSTASKKRLKQHFPAPK